MEEKSKLKSWAHIKPWLRKHRKVILVITGAVFVVATSVTTCLILSKNNGKKTVVKAKTVRKETPEPTTKYYSPLTGKLVANEAAAKQAVTAIMIENSPDARPQSGLKDSGIVFEAIAEGGITRFLVLYQQEKPQLIGPVRSVRMYYVDWLAAFNASIAHVGGSAAALAEVRNGNYRDIDQFFNAGTYWRATDRYAPHNVYTNFEKIDTLNKSKGYNTSNFTGFARTDGKVSDKPNANTVAITISGPLYNSSYAYNKTTNSYDRSQAGAPHTDRESGQISPSVVVAMRVDETTTMEDGYRQSIATIGNGTAVIFQNGTATNAKWNKASKADQIKFTDDSGKEIPLVRGQTWIAAVPNNGGDVTWQ